MIERTISHYKILEKIGEGGMGVVYKAQDVKLNRVVALKFMPGEAQLNQEDRQRFLQEAQSAALLNHPNVCTIHDIKDEGEHHFIVMEFVDGQTLRKRIYGSAGQHLDEKTALGYAVQIGEALTEAHRQGIVHRDIKADNIMINARGQVKVMDFGLAKLKGSMKLTSESSTIGTLAYMAPEQLRGEEVDTRSDVFSYGVLLFEMLTGRMPFRGEHEAAMMYTIMNEPPEPVSKYNPEATADVERIIDRALEKDPEDRYQHIDDLVSELRRLQKKTGRVGRPVSGGDIPVPGIVKQPSGPVAGSPVPLAPSGTADTGESGTLPSERSGGRPGRTVWKTAVLSIAGGILLSLAIAVYLLFFTGKGEKIDSLAVLPFVNVGGDPEVEYLTEGVTDYLTNTLSQMPGLRVLPSSFVSKYRNQELQPNRVGTELGVGAILTGRVVHRNGKLTIQTELIDVAGISQLWGERYEKDVAELQELQSDIVAKVSDRLDITLGSKEKASLRRGSTDNTEAYQLYLKGRYQWNKRTTESARAAIGYFQRAIDLDPSFALAYVGFAQTIIFPGATDEPTDVRMPKMRAAAERALAIDETMAEAHTTLAFYLGAYERDFVNAEKEYRRALELDPDYPTGLHWFAEFLCWQGRFDEGLAFYREAAAADPLSLAIATDVGYGYYVAREYDSAATYLENILRTDPEYERTYTYLIPVYIAQGKPEKVHEMMRQIAMKAGESGNLHAVDSAWRADGLKGLARLQLNFLERHTTVVDTPYIAMADIYTVMGLKDSAIMMLQEGVRAHDIYDIGIGVKALMDPLRGDPRFRALIRKVGLEEAERRALERKID